MVILGDLLQVNPSLLLLAIIASAWYVASRLAADALSGRGPAAKPAWRAVGHWLPVAVVAVIAALRQQPAIALGIAFASSVACLSLALGVVTVTSPPIVL